MNRYVDVLAEIVGDEPDVVYVPDDDARRARRARCSATCSAFATTPWSASRRRSACSASIATTCAQGHEDTYEWFQRKGYADVDGPMVDPMWKASWDFDAEAAVAEQVRGA